MYRYATLLQNRDIIRMHQLHQSGTPVNEIARMLGIHPNNVIQHLQFRISYTRDVFNKLKHLAPQINTDFPIPLLHTAPMLPGWPSQHKLYDLVKIGVIKGTKKRIGRSTCLMVGKKQLQDAAEQIMPLEGLFIRSNSLGRLTTLPERSHAHRSNLARFDLAYWPARRYYWIRAADINEHLAVPVAQIHLANLCIQITGRAAIA